jgi:hypothetical protein
MINWFAFKIVVLTAFLVFLVVIGGFVMAVNKDYEQRCGAVGGVVVKVAGGWSCL